MEMTLTLTLLEIFKFLFVFAVALFCGFWSAGLMVRRDREVRERERLLSAKLTPAGEEPRYALQIMLASAMQIGFLLQLGYWFAQYAG
jgi:hypothetical protein